MWLAHCRDKCSELGVSPLSRSSVHIEPAGQGIEGSGAPRTRMAPVNICARWNANVVLTAHHVNDQAETVLMQLLRDLVYEVYLAWMLEIAQLTPLGNPDLMIARPLLGEGRETFEAYARFTRLPYRG